MLWFQEIPLVWDRKETQQAAAIFAQAYPTAEQIFELADEIGISDGLAIGDQDTGLLIAQLFERASASKHMTHLLTTLMVDSNRQVQGDQLRALLAAQMPVLLSTTDLASRIEGSGVIGYEPVSREAIWNEVAQLDGSEHCLFYFIGRTLHTITGRTTIEDLIAHPNVRIRLFLSNPNLLRQYASDPGQSELLEVMTSGRQLEFDANAAAESLYRLQSFMSNLSPEASRRIDIRVGHNVVPFGATVKRFIRTDGATPSHPSMMVLRLLPFWPTTYRERTPHLIIQETDESGLYSFYLEQIKGLIIQGSPVDIGGWPEHDRDDLFPDTRGSGSRKVSFDSITAYPARPGLGSSQVAVNALGSGTADDVRALREWLAGAFSRPELKVLISENYPEVARAVDWNDPVTVEFDLVIALRKRRYVDVRFFELLKGQRPRREDELDKLEDRFRRSR